MNNELCMEYNFRGGQPRSIMRINLNKLFQINEDKCKLLHVGHTKKIIKHILKHGSEENIKQVEDWLRVNSPYWFKEFEKTRG